MGVFWSGGHWRLPVDFLGKAFLAFSTTRAVEMKPVKALSRLKSPRCMLLFLFGFGVFLGEGGGHMEGTWRNLSWFGVSENSVSWTPVNMLFHKTLLVFSSAC